MRTQVLRIGIALVATWTSVTFASASESKPLIAVSTLPAKAMSITRLRTPISIDVRNHRLEDVLAFIADSTGIEMDPMWLSDRHEIGMDRESRITLTMTNSSALSVLERVLTLAIADSTGAFGMTWQIGDNNTLQVGPRERLNAFRRVEIYNISDLLAVTPDFTNAPGFDLNNILQSQNGRGGGNASSPFTIPGTYNPTSTGFDGGNIPFKSERAEELKNLIIAFVEPDQWVENGYEAATIKYYQNAFIINAPEYVHRALAGNSR